MGRTLQATLAEGNKQKCGYAAVADVSTGKPALSFICVPLQSVPCSQCLAVSALQSVPCSQCLAVSALQSVPCSQCLAVSALQYVPHKSAKAAVCECFSAVIACNMQSDTDYHPTPMKALFKLQVICW